MSVGANMVQEYCRVCGEPLGVFALETAHWWHERGCHDAPGLELGCDCSGWVHPHCCPCELEHEVEA